MYASLSDLCMQTSRLACLACLRTAGAQRRPGVCSGELSCHHCSVAGWQVLQDSLCGSSKVLLVTNLAPEAASAAETLSSLSFAARAAKARTTTEIAYLGMQTACPYNCPVAEDDISLRACPDVSTYMERSSERRMLSLLALNACSMRTITLLTCGAGPPRASLRRLGLVA